MSEDHDDLLHSHDVPSGHAVFSEGVPVTRFAKVFVPLLLAMAISDLAAAEQTGAEPTNLTCDIGPVSKTFGNSPWLVYSCNDGRTVIIVSAPGNAAMPFYFTLSPTGSGYRLSGEGTGSQEVTAAAFSDLETLSPKDIANLVEQTRRR